MKTIETRGVVNLSDYELPVCDTQKERRNFPGYNEYDGLYEPEKGDSEGTTDTDIRTHTDYESHMKGYSRRDNKATGYTRINQTQGKGRKRK